MKLNKYFKTLTPLVFIGAALVTPLFTSSCTNISLSHTVLIYMCGANLESNDKCATYNLNQILAANFDKNVNVVIETGGAKSWHTPNISHTNLQR
jgi:hypothetical protein